ncbi:MAG: NUDIX hydrolase [Pyrinomonadaceae bacterium]
MLKKIVGTIWGKMPRLMRQQIIRSSQTAFTVSVAAIIINDDDQVLLLDHVLRIGLTWGIPGGFIERGEQLEEGLRREIREETGLELENVTILRTRTLDRHIEVLFSATATGEAQVKSREIKAVKWFTDETLPENMSCAHKLIVRKILRSKRKNENN